MRVVGRAVLSPVSQTQGLGLGAVVSNTAITSFESVILPALRPTFRAPPPGDAFVRFSPGTSRDAAIATLERRLGGIGSVLVTAPSEPSDVVDFGQVRDLPQLLAGLLGAVATLTLAHLLVTAVRRRRRDLAVFKTLGFVPRQVSAAVAWQATALSVLALIVGIPVGIAAGRFVWSLMANSIGVVVEPTVPWVWVGVVVPATLLIANLVAAGPAAAAARVAPSTVLRSE
jgi:ABC-type antimicrobial peptide transport system permease subunit